MSYHMITKIHLPHLAAHDVDVEAELWCSAFVSFQELYSRSKMYKQ